VSRTLRADAQRNYDAVVDAARAAFAEKGTGASLDDVAVRAGVGNATLYRHFPTRDSLVVEAMRFRFAELDAIARELASHPDPAIGLREWIIEVTAVLRSWRGLPEVVADSLGTDSPMRTACQPVQLRSQMLLLRAQDAGAARPSLTSDELFALILSLAWSGERFVRTEPELEHDVDVVLAGVLA
jgi:AcrR family transcriptional regulator